MKLTITDKKKLSEIQNEFQKAFPYLKIEFYKHLHDEGEGSKKNDTADNTKTIFEIKNEKVDASINVKGDLTVTEFEPAIAEVFKMGAQVFRKSGDIWLQTTATDHLTLDEQNQKAIDWFESDEEDEIIDAMDRQDLE